MEQVHLSVVMPVFNERFLVLEAVERVLRVSSRWISKLEVIVVDDGSTDGTRERLRKWNRENPGRVRYVEHVQNRGKGAAVRTGIEEASGDVVVVQDADLEYDPQDFDRLMLPFVRENADAVYGSRFVTREYRRVLYYRHTLGNQLLTFFCNLLTDLNLSDMETCYKAVRTPLLRSIPLRSNDFRIEPELTIKLAKRDARIFEVPINYAGRTYAEGKKIGWRDALLAVWAMLRFSLRSDAYPEDDRGARILGSLSKATRFNSWMADAIRPWVGSRVLEIGSGIGNITRLLGPREAYTASDVSIGHLDALETLANDKTYLDVARIDLRDPEDFYELHGAYDTVICLNVLEHVDDERTALENMRSALESDGRAIVLVPQGPWLYGTLDHALGHVRRYTRADLRQALETAGFEVEALFDFNRVTVPAWWLNGRVLGRRHFGGGQLRVVNWLTPLLRKVDRWLPWTGTSLIAIGRPRDFGQP